MRVGFRPVNLNKSTTSTLSTLANFSNPATEGAFTPRSTRLMNYTEQPILFASSVCGIFCVLRRSAIRRPSFF